MSHYKNNSICWDCANACCNCSWSQSFTPVDGWKATPTRIKQSEGVFIESYIVHECPCFVKDIVRQLKQISTKQLALKLDLPCNTVSKMKNQDLIDLCLEHGIELSIGRAEDKQRQYFIVQEYFDPNHIPTEILKLFFGKKLGYTGF